VTQALCRRLVVTSAPARRQPIRDGRAGGAKNKVRKRCRDRPPPRSSLGVSGHGALSVRSRTFLLPDGRDNLAARSGG
jgi:hypothetical protein